MKNKFTWLLAGFILALVLLVLPGILDTALPETPTAPQDSDSVSALTGTPGESLRPTAEPMPTSIPASGVFGKVLIGPNCPVMTPENPCPDQPYQAVIQVVQADQERMTVHKTSEDGTFRITLPPGEYTLEPLTLEQANQPTPKPGQFTRQTFPFGDPQQVEVLPGEFTEVTIHFDTGIR